MIVLPLSPISFVAPAHLSQWGHRQDRVASNNPEAHFSHFVSALMCLDRARPLRRGKSCFVSLCSTLTSSLTQMNVAIQRSYQQNTGGQSDFGAQLNGARGTLTGGLRPLTCEQPPRRCAERDKQQWPTFRHVSFQASGSGAG